MRTQLFAALAATALAATPVAAHPAKQGEATPATATASEPPSHEQCRAVMGRKMEPRQPHDHGRDKTGAATWPKGKPLSKAEMDKMHARCAERLAKTPPAK
jgi:hypothetical protein